MALELKETAASTAKRAGRVAVGTAIAGVVAASTGNPMWLALAPLLAALGKFLRSLFGLTYIPF